LLAPHLGQTLGRIITGDLLEKVLDRHRHFDDMRIAIDDGMIQLGANVASRKTRET
jgi:hypothetical protein